MHSDFPPIEQAPATPGGADTKLLATLRARCALIGVALHVTDDDRGRTMYLVSKWSLTRQLGSVDEVQQFIADIGGPRA